MLSSSSNPLTTGTPHTGPLNNDPLTDNERAVLLSIPHWADKVPNFTIFRFPLGPDPTQGWVDVTFSEARSIIARLAVDWKTRLSNATDNLNVGPGLTICLLVQPIAHVMLHWIAFWALGCSIQVVSLSMDDDAISLYIKKSGCRVVVHSGVNDTRVERICSGWNGSMIKLAEEEHAHQLALTDLTLPWPELQRPDPAIILHSSGSTGTAKLLGFSLYFITPGLPSGQKPGDPNPRPFLIFSPPYWQSFNAALVNQLICGTPMAFPYVLDIAKFPSWRLIDWARNLGAGGVICAPRFIRDTLTSGSESDIKFLQGLYNIVATGSTLDESTAALIEKYKLNFRNVFGCTELTAILLTSHSPYTHLSLLPSSSPLVHPISDTDPDGSRQVQFWFSASTSPRIAHLRAKGTVPLKFEPFPGDGPHNGEPAVRLDDIFKQVRTGSQVSYIHLGRSDDLIKLAGNGGWDINASTYETELISAITSYVSRQPKEKVRWTVEGVQLFGNNRPCTALVIQLCLFEPVEVDQDLVEDLSSMVELVNNKLKLEPRQRVHPQKRMLVMTSEGRAYGPGAYDEVPRLMVTHKHTLQRWKNVQGFRTWLDILDYSEP